MAALSGSRNTAEMTEDREFIYPVEANTNIYLGALVGLNSSGNAVPMSATPGLKVIGRAERVYQGKYPGENALNNPGSAGAMSIVVRRGIFLFNNSSGNVVAQANVGATCFAEDDHTVAASDGGSATAVNAEAHTLPADGPLVVQLTDPVNVSDVVVKNSSDTTTYVLGVDYYIVDAANGIIGFMGGTLVASTVVHISYNHGAAANPAAGRVVGLDISGGVWVDTRFPFAIAA